MTALRENEPLTGKAWKSPRRSCTFGQGITGLSTLAIGAFLATGSIILGSAVTMKVQYYKLLHDDEATLPKALVTALVDLRLLPSSMRQLDAL